MPPKSKVVKNTESNIVTKPKEVEDVQKDENYSLEFGKMLQAFTYETEEVVNYAEIMPVVSNYAESTAENTATSTEKLSNELTQDELFTKLQNYKKLLCPN